MWLVGGGDGAGWGFYRPKRLAYSETPNLEPSYSVTF
jgi:hypothetical protein